MAVSRWVRFGLLVWGWTLAGGAAAQKLVTPGYLFNSDPTCRQIGDRLYLFATQDPFPASILATAKTVPGV